MPIVNIAIAKGRSLDQKRTLTQEVTRVVSETLNVDEKKIWIRIDEFDPENFAVGGTLMSDKKPPS